MVSREEAMDIAFRVAADRGCSAKLDDIDKKKDHWKVELDVMRGNDRGEMEVRVARDSGAVLDVKEKFKRNDKRDDDDDDHSDKGKGNDKHDDDDDDDDD